MPKIAQTQDDLNSELKSQLHFLMKSCLDFDNGDLMEAKRMSVALRTLIKETKNCHSLIGMTIPDLKLVSYVCDYKPDESKIWVQRNLLVSTLVNPVHQYLPNYIPAESFKRALTISEWCQEIVITDSAGREFSRNTIFLSVAEQDGGAHVDPKLDSDYHALMKQNSQGSFIITGISELPEKIPLDAMKSAMPPVWHTIRQMAHEVFESLGIDYQYDPRQYYAGLAFSGMGLF